MNIIALNMGNACEISIISLDNVDEEEFKYSILHYLKENNYTKKSESINKRV